MYQLLNVPYERCPIFARMAHDAAVHALYELELNDCGLKKVRRDVLFSVAMLLVGYALAEWLFGP